MRRTLHALVLAAAALPAAAVAQQDRALTITPRAGYVLGGTMFNRTFGDERGGRTFDELKVDNYLSVGLTAAYRMGRSPFALFADLGTGQSNAVRNQDRLLPCDPDAECSYAAIHQLGNGDFGPITLSHAAAGIALRVEDRRGSGGTMNLMLGAAVTTANYREDYSGNAWSPRSYNGRGAFLGVDVTHPITSRVQLRGGVSDLVTRIRGPELDPPAEFNITSPTLLHYGYQNRVRFTAGMSVGM